MKKSIIAALLLSSIILTSCSINLEAPSGSPSKTASSIAPTATIVPLSSPAGIQKPTPKQSIKLTNESANTYLKIINDVLATQSSYSKLLGQDYTDSMYCGCLFDLDIDGQNELIMAFPVDNSAYFYFEIYTFKSGSSVLVKRGQLFVGAGNPEGGLSIVSYNGEKYICVWDRNSNPGDTSLNVKYNYELFTYKDSQLISKYKFKFTYQWLKGNKLPLEGKAGLFKNGLEISFDEFLKTQDALENPVNVLCIVGKSEPPYRLRQLYEDIKNR